MPDHTTVPLTSQMLLNKHVLTVLPMINGILLIIAYAATPDAESCNQTEYKGAQQTLLAVSTLSLGLGILHFAGGCSGKGTVPYVSLLQAVNLVAIIVLSVMIANAGDKHSSPTRQCCDLLADKSGEAKKICDTAMMQGSGPCSSGKGWVIAALIGSVLNMLVLFPVLHASVRKFGPIFPKITAVAEMPRRTESSEMAPRRQARLSSRHLKSNA